MEISPFYKIKCLFAGEMATGKSSLVHLIHNNSPIKDSEPTIGVGFASTIIELDEYPLSNPTKLPKYYFEAKESFLLSSDKIDNVNNQLIKVHCWDASGNAKFFSIMQNYLRDVDICFLVFDITNRESWERLEMWRNETIKYSKFEKFPLFVIIGNKSDLKNHAITVNEIKARSEQWKCKYYITSAVQESSFSMLRRILYKSIQEYHDTVLLLSHENNINIPPQVFSSFYIKKREYLDLEQSSSNKICCYQ